MAATNPVDVFPKDPNATLDYTMDWSDWLGEDAIQSITWTLPALLTSVDQLGSSATATIWISGGVAGSVYLVVCHITTVGGRADDRTWQFNVGDR